MKKKYLLLSLFLIGALAVTTTNVNSKATSPPAGSAGDPFSNLTCSQSGCHPGPVQTPGVGDLTLNIGTGTPTTPLDNTFTYTPGTAYNIGFAINLSVSPNPYYGFQIVAFDAAHNQAGTMTVTNTVNTKINTVASRQYMGHNNANSNKSWGFTWTAPAVSTGPVIFYYCFNTASASAVPPVNPEGTIYHNSVTIQEGPTGIADISDKISGLNVLPNPVSNEFRISFDLKKAERVFAQLYSLDGKLSKELFNENQSEGSFNRSFDINNLPSGIYLMKLNVGEASVTQKIMKL